MKKSLSLLLVLCLLLCVFSPMVYAKSYITSKSSACGGDYTESPALADVLNNVFAGDIDIYSNSGCTTEKSLPLGCNMNNDQQYWIKSKTTGNGCSGWQCYIYANAVYNMIYKEWVGNGSSFSHSTKVISGGSSTASYSMFNNAGVRCGAYMRTTNNSSGAYNGNAGHSLIILSYDNSSITYLEGNGDGKGLVRIATMTWSEFNSGQLSGRSRYICHVVQPTSTYYNDLYGGSSMYIKFDSNGGSGSMDMLKVKYHQDFTLPQNTFTKSGYTFAGWNVKRASDSSWYVMEKGWFSESTINSNGYEKRLYADKTNLTFDSSWYNHSGYQIKSSDGFTFYAIWKAKTYTVSYNANGGSNAPASQTKTYGTNLTLSSTKPTRTGYTFQGWATSASATSATYAAGATYSNNSAVTLYAVWKANTYTVSYNANGGSGAPASQTKTYGTNLTLSSTKPTRTGYTFQGWATSESATSATYAAGATYSNNSAVTLYAVWKINTYTVSYNANGGSGAPASQTKTYGTNLTLSSTKPTRSVTITLNPQSGTVSPASKTVSYTFKNWNTKADGSGTTYASGASYSANAAATLYAQWTAPAAYTLPTPTRTGYTFKGWNTKADGTGTNYAAGASYSATTNVTLYAQWAINTYTVSYNANGGTGAPASQTKTHGTNLTLSSTKPTRTGYTFQGWATSADATSAQYQPGATFAASSSVTLYAVWMMNYVPTKTFAYNGHIYEIYPHEVTWEKANTLCNTFGGHLATITTENELNAVMNYFDTTLPTGLWIGLTDKETEGTFKWVTNEAFSYSNWDTTGDIEPNNNGDEDYVMIYPYDIGNNVKGCWNDDGSSKTKGFICEYETSSLKEVATKQSASGKTYYLIDQKMTWTAANEYAKTVCGGRLASIKSSTEAAEVKDLLTKGSKTYYWIGLSRYNPETKNISSSFLWRDGSALSYTNYLSGEPNDLSHVEYFVEINKSDNLWDDVKNMGRELDNNTVAYGFIVEKDITYNVNYNANGGSNAPASQTKTYGKDLTLSSSVPVKDKYTFVGWATSNTATTATYAPGAVFKTNANTTLYAVWELTHVHSYTSKITTKATCTTDGIKTFTCLCGDSYTETIKATGHKNTVRITEKKPTCLEKGSEDEYCLDCSELVGTYEIPALGHDNSGEWVVEKAATCTENGSKSLYCKRCNVKIDTEEITALGHNFVFVEKNENHPHNEKYKCSRCGEIKTTDSIYSETCPECNFTSTATDNNSCKITGYTGNLEKITIPATLNGKKVISTNTGALKANSVITEVTIEDGVSEIGSLTFMNCTNLEKVVVPESVTTIGSMPFYGCADGFKVYCYRGSFAQEYCETNSIDYVIIDIAAQKGTEIDYENKLIFTQKEACFDILDLLKIPSTSIAVPMASYTSAGNEYLGTGSTVTVFENKNYIGDYKVIVEGDLDGDSVCDVLDITMAERIANKNATATKEQIYAANGCVSEEIDVMSYQNVVNSALS